MILLKGVCVPHRKNTAAVAPVRITPPGTVTIPMSMHIGAPAEPIVKAGDSVKLGQPIARAGGFVSAPIFASVSGRVKKLTEIPGASGRAMKAVIIESDGLMEPWEGITPPVVTDYESFLEAVRESGVVGLGGAGFPTSVKLSVKDLGSIETFIINGAECEPYVTSDTRTMLDEADWIKCGAELLETYMLAKRIVIGIEKNKPECVKKLAETFKNDPVVEIRPLPPVYPQGGEKVLIYHVTGRTVPEGKLPIDAGAIVLNVTTLAAIAKYIKTGMPLTEKCVTVDGGAVREPKNVIAPIGTPLRELFEFCGGFREEPKKVIYGGPMMGVAVPDMELPVMKNTNAALAFTEREARLPKPTPCIRCGSCIDVCPLGLMPAFIEDALEKGDGAALKKLKVNLCMECGSCAFACPAKRPLVQTHKLAKAALNAYNAKEKAKAERKEAAK